MINKIQPSLGLEVNVPVPETVAEFDQLAGKEGACLENATNNVVYRSILAQFRRLLVTVVEDISGIKRELVDSGKTKKEKNDAGEEVDVPVLEFAPQHATEKKYIEDACRQTGKSLRALVSIEKQAEIEAQLTFDPSEREAGSKKIPDYVTNIVNKIVAAGVVEQVASDLSAELEYTVDPTPEGLAKAVHANELKKAAAKGDAYIASATS